GGRYECVHTRPPRPRSHAQPVYGLNRQSTRLALQSRCRKWFLYNTTACGVPRNCNHRVYASIAALISPHVFKPMVFNDSNGAFLFPFCFIADTAFRASTLPAVNSIRRGAAA